MELQNLYPLVLTIVLIGMILGVGILVLDKFQEANTTSAAANTSLTGTVTAMSPIATTWLPLVITVAVLAIILVLVIRSFAGAGSR